MGAVLTFVTHYTEGDELLDSIVMVWNVGISAHTWQQTAVDGMGPHLFCHEKEIQNINLNQ